MRLGSIKGLRGIDDLFGAVDDAMNAGSELVNPTEDPSNYSNMMPEDYSGYNNDYTQYNQYPAAQTLPGQYQVAQVYNPATGQYQPAAQQSAVPVLNAKAAATPAAATPAATNTFKEWFDKNQTLVLVGGAAVIGLIIFMNMKK